MKPDARCKARRNKTGIRKNRSKVGREDEGAQRRGQQRNARGSQPQCTSAGLPTSRGRARTESWSWLEIQRSPPPQTFLWVTIDNQKPPKKREKKKKKDQKQKKINKRPKKTLKNRNRQNNNITKNTKNLNLNKPLSI